MTTPKFTKRFTLRDLIRRVYQTNDITIGRNPRRPKMWLVVARVHREGRTLAVVFMGSSLVGCAMSNQHTAAQVRAEAARLEQTREAHRQKVEAGRKKVES